MKAICQRAAYRIMIALAMPLALWLGWRQDKPRWRERLGHYDILTPTDAPIWLHAASLGEAKAGAQLIEALREQGCAAPFVVTTTTATGAAAIAPALTARDQHRYAPYDSPACVWRALDAIAPCLLLVMEVEIWPRLWQETERRGIPIVLANARLSKRSLQRYQRRLPALWRETLGCARLILAQSETIAERYRALGVAPERLAVTGNLKYGISIAAATREQGQHLRTLLGEERPVWLAASTHEGEEAIALECQRQLLKTHPKALLVVVPRHPQRFESVAELCASSGLTWQRRSNRSDPVAPDTQIYLADTLGELLALYSAADLAWVAGSFANVGGHNILEPAACDCPLVVGPDMRNFEQITQAFIESEALRQVNTPADLANTLILLLENPNLRQRQATAARQQLHGYQHAATDQAQAVLSLLKRRDAGAPGTSSL